MSCDSSPASSGWRTDNGDIKDRECIWGRLNEKIVTKRYEDLRGTLLALPTVDSQMLLGHHASKAQRQQAALSTMSFQHLHSALLVQGTARD